MSSTIMNKATSMNRLLSLLTLAAAALIGPLAHAAAPGITGPAFQLVARPEYLNQPDGNAIYSWGYGCNGTPAGFAPAGMTGATCPTMQVPGPTLIVRENDTVTITLTNNLPNSAGNTSMLFPGFTVTTTGGVQGLLTQEAAPGSTVTYSFKASSPGTRAYYSGTQSDLQVEMGLYGAIIVLPKTIPSACTSGVAKTNTQAQSVWGETDFRLAAAAYDHPKTCYDREYMFQFAEMDSNIHRQALAQVTATTGCTAGAAGCSLAVPTEPYHPSYFLINGRSMPDDMDGNYGAEYPHQPYNGNPHMHPGDLVLMRVIGQGRWQHPFHHHGNHARVLARDGNLITSQSDPSNTALAGPLVFTVPTVSGQTLDAIFTWTGQGLNWDVYGSDAAHAHTCNGIAVDATIPQSVGFDSLTHEYCPDHGKPLPVTAPDKNIVANGLWYGGSPYLGTPAGSSLVPGTTEINTGGSYAYMWHSHDEREITTNDVFPGGMMMMLLIDPPGLSIDEQQ